MSSGRIGANSLVLLGAEGVRRVIAFVSYAMIARALTVDDFGRFRLANAFFAILLVLANFGIGPLIIKLVAEKREDERGLMNHALGLRIALGLAAVGATWLLARALRYDSPTTFAIMLMACAIPLEAFTTANTSFFDGRQVMKYAAWVDIGRSIVLIAGIGLALLMRLGLVGVISAYLLNYLFGVILSETFAKKMIGPYRPQFQFERWKTILREAYPFLLIGIIWIVAFRINMVLLSKLRNEASVGYFGAAYSLFEALLALPLLFTRALYPALAEGSTTGADAETMRKSLRVFALIALPFGLGTALLARPAIELVYGAKYAPAAAPLALLSVFLWLWFATMSLSWAMTARGHLKIVLRANIVAMIVNIIANVILIPLFDFSGAAAASVISESAYLAVVAGPVNREILPLDRRIVHPGAFVAAFPMCAAVWFLRDRMIVIPFLAGAVVFVATAWVSGALREPFILSMVKKVASRRSD